ncbi:single-stranded DNA-binding protein [Bifidobacterium sp. ESL0745]|uniref:single-stranded DNA-binding protein n=1 Tax=Bifidobacterium sp. ESL0745 TaxID=2983226 RepID=UPI0023F77BDF|nr:single-stranded DNA-binding protein [Bifidobacterium sp. ESL0745]MDF7665328.1 single-stranded DNA-binding protein [Bifidobacterium sp. ESL0745]
MAQQGTVTVSGFVGANPQRFGKEGGPAASSFRIGCTTSYFNPVANEWRDRPTTWITVKVFRKLAENVQSSLHKGDPVIATGNLATEEWVRDGTKHSRMVMEATSVGHDLSFGISVFQRVRPGGKEQGNAHDADSAESGHHEMDTVAEPQASMPDDTSTDSNREAAGRQNDSRSDDVVGQDSDRTTTPNDNNVGDEAGEDPWDASGVFEGHATADRLVAAVG